MSKQTLAVAGALLFASASIFAAPAQQSTATQPPAKPAASASAQQKAADDLQRAAQRLRDALAALEKEAPGPNRDRAVKAARDALQNTHDVMARLQSEAKYVASRSAPQAATGSTGTRPSPAEAMKRLRSASDSLYDAVHALAKLPADADRNEAIKKADQALFETEQAAMLSELDWKLPKS
jgi:hypothetical protein